MLLVVDNGSVYTKNLIDFLTKKIEFESMSYNKINPSDLSKYDSFILSGRRKNDQKINALNSQIVKHAILKTRPLLGICYGAEILTLTLGGTIKKSKFPRNGTQKISITEKNPLCNEKIDVFESHTYEISRLGNSLVSIGNSNSCKNEIIRYNNSNIFGTQFHPEMTIDGKNLIKKFYNLK